MSKLVAVCLFGLTLSLIALPAQSHHCKGRHADEPGCPGNNAEGVPYRIDYDFFDAPTATVSFETIVECTNQYCEFSADGLAFDFNLPDSYLNLFTEGEQQACFGEDDPSTVWAHAITFRSGHGGTEWHAHVEAIANTRAGDQDDPVNYTFHFGGPCSDSVCPLLPQSPGWSEEFNGELFYVDVPSRGKGKRAPGCTCAWEDCAEPQDTMDLTLTQE